MNKAEYIEVTVDQIDLNDRSYIFTFESPISQLVSSIKQVGLIHPPILEQKINDTFRIVTGLKRILALGHLKISQFPAQVYDAKGSAPDLQLFLLNFYDNIGTRNLNIVEQAIIIHKLINMFHLSDDRVISEFFPLLGLGTNKLVLDRYLQLVQLEDNIKIAVAEDFISINIAVALLKRTRLERQEILELFQHLKLGKNRQKQFLRLLEELSEITNQSIDQILLDHEIRDVLSNDKITLPGKTERIKQVLKKMRYPLFANVEKNFLNLKKDLKLPPNIILRPPPFFEGEKYILELRFKNQSEFNKLIMSLNSISEQNKLAKLETLV